MASRILLADDSITIQKVVNLTFADEGIEVVAVSNGDLAERRLAEVSPDLVLADIFMPGKNGYELCEVIKENPQFRNVPVVLLVGAFEPFDQVEAKRVRADAHLTKPFESRTLVETVRRLISASPRTTTGPVAPAPLADDHRDEGRDAQAPEASTAPAASPLAGRLDLSAMMAESNFAASTQVRNTGELASPAPEAQADPFDLSLVDAPRVEAIRATLTDTTEQFDPLEFSPNGGASVDDPPTSFGFDAPMIQDFDTSQPVGKTASPDSIFVETKSRAEAGPDGAAAANAGSFFDQSAFDPTSFDRPSGDSQWQPHATSAPLTYQSPDFRLQPDATLSSSESSNETACATLLAVDEPLGDVLFDESVSVNPLALSQTHAGDALSLEFMEENVSGVLPSASTQFDLVETVEDSAPEASPSFEENVAARESLAADLNPSPDDRPEESTAAGELSQSQPVSHDVADDLDWTTPRAASYSTAQLDSFAMPAAAAEPILADSIEDALKPESMREAGFTTHPEDSVEDASRPLSSDEVSGETLAENPAEEAPHAESVDEASFTNPAMWTEEEARFTPIDIEAVSVEEASIGEISAPETGFEWSSAVPEQATPDIETPVPSGSNGHAAEAAAGLSASAIEQIVRRVVAEMSESVVREVAWEVVPDCVERVIEQLTRESLSKRA